MRKKIISVLIAIIFLLLVSNCSCRAASATIVCNDKVIVGEKTFINVMVNGFQWDLKLKVNGEVVASNSYNENVSKSLTFTGVYTPSKEENLNVTLTGSVKEKLDGIPIEQNMQKIITVQSNSNEENSNQSNITTETTSQIPDQQKPTTNKKSSDASLSDLWITPKEYDFKGFSKNKTKYDVKVPNNVNSIKVNATIPKDSKAKIISGTGNVTLKEGENKLEIKVIAEDGTQKTYTLNITREKANENTTNSEELNKPQEILEQQSEKTPKVPIGLKSLEIKSFNLSPEFDSQIYEYTIELTENISSFDINAEATNSNTTIEIIGNKELKDGENIITILVSDSEKDENATYQIIVNKNMSSNEIIGKVNWLQPSTWGVKEKRLIGIVSIIVLMIVIIIAIRIKIKSNMLKYMDLPGTEELDKAILEHQELSEDFSEIETIDEKTQNIIETEIKEGKVEKKIPEEYFEDEPVTNKKGKHF